MDRGKMFERLLRRNLPEILTPLATMTRKWLRPAYAQRDFQHLWAELKGLGRYFPALETLNYLQKTLIFSKMDRGKVLRLLRSNLLKIIHAA